MRGIFIILQLLCLGLVTACQNHPTEPQAVVPDSVSATHTQFGMAAIYSDHRTASGERFNAASHTAAHRTWPMGCRVRVTHLGTGRQVIVRINDRGPYTRGWVIDLTPSAAAEIGLTRRQGITRVKIERLK